MNMRASIIVVTHNRVGARLSLAPPTPPAIRVSSTAVSIRHVTWLG